MADNQAQVQEKVDYDDPTERRGDILAAFKASEGIKESPIPAAAVAAPKSASANPDTSSSPRDSAPEVIAAEAEPASSEQAAVAAPEGPIPANWGRWSKADKERFLEQPEGSRKLIIDRIGAMEADYTKKTMGLAELEKEFEPVRQMFQPYREQLRQAGFTPSSAIQSWMAAEQALMNPNTREDAMRGLAQAYGIDLRQLAGVQPQAAQASPIDPSQMTEQQQIDALLAPIIAARLGPYEQKIKELQDGLNKATQFQNGFAQTEVQRRQTEIMNEVQSFAAAKDATGNLLHPYFSDVEQQMAAMLAGYHQMKLPAPALDELYKQAVRANPSTYERLEAQQRTAADTQRLTEARAKAAKANRAGSSVSGSPTGGQTFSHANGDGRELSIRDSLMAAVEATRQ